MNIFSAILSILVINAAAVLCLLRKTDADEVMGKRLFDGRKDHIKRSYYVFIETYLESEVQEKPTPCGGVLIESDLVLSAARCFHPYKNLTKVIVKVGNWHRNWLLQGKKKEIEAVSVEVYEVFVQKKSYEDEPDSERSPDIARLKLASAAVDEKDVLHSCGSDFWNERKNRENFKDKQLLIVGMGIINSRRKKPKVLRSLSITVADKLKCESESASRFVDNIDRICAVGTDELLEYLKFKEKQKKSTRKPIAEKFKFDSGACDGDEGGPVIDAFSDRPPCLVGVINQGFRAKGFRLNLCPSGILFTSIENLEDWVKHKQFEEIFQKKFTSSPLPPASKKSSWAALKSVIGSGIKFGKGTTKVPK